MTHKLTIGKPSIKKKCTDKDIVLICLDPLPPPLNKDIKNKDILVSFLTPLPPPDNKDT